MSHHQNYSRPASSRDVGVYRAKARERTLREDKFELNKAIHDLKQVSQAIYTLEGKLHRVMRTARWCFEGTEDPRYSSLAEEIRKLGSSLQNQRTQINATVEAAEGNNPPLIQDMRTLHASGTRAYRNGENRLLGWRDNGF